MHLSSHLELVAGQHRRPTPLTAAGPRRSQPSAGPFADEVAAEVLPQAMRAAEFAVDPTPIFAVVRGVLRIYADALERPDAP